MKPAERIELIKKVAQRCSEMPWPEMNLTLRQFGVPWSDEWGGTIEGYALWAVEQAQDDNLFELEEYLFPGASKEIEPPSSLLPWKEGYFRLFLSHISRKKGFVRDVKEHLAKYGVDGFVAHMDIRPTKKWVDVIEGALRSCDAAAAFLTTGFNESVWTDQEIGFVVARGRPVIPIDLGMTPYGFIARYQALSVTEVEPRAIAADIFEVLIEHEETRSRMALVLVNRLATSDNFRRSIFTMDLITRKITTFTPQMVKTMQDAATSNSQVRQAFKVPEKIEAIAAKLGVQETVS